MPIESEVPTPWLTVRQAAKRVQCGVKLIYGAASTGRLKVTRVGGRRDIRIKPEWIDAWLEGASTSKEG
jgi:excisionase family DNA binding protein